MDQNVLILKKNASFVVGDHVLTLLSSFIFVVFYRTCYISHLLIAGCDIGVQISVHPSVSLCVRPCVRLSTITSKLGFIDTYDSCIVIVLDIPFKHAP